MTHNLRRLFTIFFRDARPPMQSSENFLINCSSPTSFWHFLQEVPSIMQLRWLAICVRDGFSIIFWKRFSWSPVGVTWLGSGVNSMSSIQIDVFQIFSLHLPYIKICVFTVSAYPAHHMNHCFPHPPCYGSLPRHSFSTHRELNMSLAHPTITDSKLHVPAPPPPHAQHPLPQHSPQPHI